jgi:hypothetical protein
MRNSIISPLFVRFVENHTSDHETELIDAMLDAIKARDIHWMSQETEKILLEKVTNKNTSVNEMVSYINSLSKLTVADVKWMKFEGIEVYFAKEAYD